MRGLDVTSSYTADTIQFLSVLTGQEFYVRHREPSAAYLRRLVAALPVGQLNRAHAALVSAR